MWTTTLGSKSHRYKKLSLISLLNSLPQIILLVKILLRLLSVLDLCVSIGNIHHYDQKIYSAFFWPEKHKASSFRM